MIRVCILCYKLFWGNSTLCVSLVLFFSFVRVNAQFVKLNAQFARVNAQFVRENAHPKYPKNALFRVCKTKRTLLPFRRLPVSVYLYNSPIMPRHGCVWEPCRAECRPEISRHAIFSAVVRPVRPVCPVRQSSRDYPAFRAAPSVFERAKRAGSLATMIYNAFTMLFR